MSRAPAHYFKSPQPRHATVSSQATEMWARLETTPMHAWSTMRFFGSLAAVVCIVTQSVQGQSPPHDVTTTPTTTPTLTPTVTATTTGGILPTSTGGVCAGTAGNATKWWRAEVRHNGKTPTSNDTTFQYYRSAVQYGADNTGREDASEAFNFAIDAWNRTANTVTTRPAYVYVPPGTYRIKKPIQMLVSTYLIGDALNPPTFIADPMLRNKTLIRGFDSNQGNWSATKNFYMAIRNIKIDMTEISKDTHAVAIDWSTSQTASMNNVHIKMPRGSSHKGITMANGGSPLILADCSFSGGAVGIQVSNQQYNLKSLSFDGCMIGVNVSSVFVLTIQNATFTNCDFGVDMSRRAGDAIGAVSLVDSSVSGCKGGVKTYVTGNASSALTLDNFQTDGATPAVTSLGGEVLLQEPVPAGQVWVIGNEIPQGYQRGKNYELMRPEALLSNGKYLIKPAPQYESWGLDQIVNLKGDIEFPVYGNNSYDDGPHINAILQRWANICKVIFVPQGIYLTSETIYIPPGTRLVGETLSVFMANGTAFANADDPRPVMQVGKPGEKGMAEISDITVEVADVLPGAILMQVNLAAIKPGDVAVWNSLLRVGGPRHSLVTTKCTNKDTSGCKAAFALLHVTKTGSLYAEQLWGWVADHSLDGTDANGEIAQNIAVGRGALIESTQATWLLGTGFEHCVLYQYSLHQATNVYIGLQQSESPYWQGKNQPNYAPAPWVPRADLGDPTFDNCAKDDGQCRRAWGHHSVNSSNVVSHGSALWVFYNGMNDNKFADASCEDHDKICQLNMVYLADSNSTFMFSLSSKSSKNLVYDLSAGHASVASQSKNAGGWGAVVAAYLKISGFPANVVGGHEEESVASAALDIAFSLVVASTLVATLACAG